MKNIERPVKIAFILAHPDDEHVPFGLPAQLAQDGDEVHLISVSDGSLGSHTITSRRKIARIRKNEFLESAKLIGAKARILKIPDGTIQPYARKQRRILLGTLREINPDIVIIPNSNDYHDDHVKTHELAKWTLFHMPDSPIKTYRLFRRIPPTQKTVAVYEADTQGSQTWQSTHEDTGENNDNLAPVNMIIPITPAAIEKSLAAFQQHKSQLSPRPNEQLSYPALAKLGAMRRGKQIGSDYGAGLTFIPFGGYAFSTEDKLGKIYNKNVHFLFDKV